MSKTPDYIRRAVNNYQGKFDKVTINLHKGNKDRIRELTGLSVNKYINDLVEDDLDRLESLEKAKAKPEAWDDMTDEERELEAFT